MFSKRQNYFRLKSLRPFVVLIMAIVLMITIWFIPPSNFLIVWFFIIFTTITTSVASTYFSSKRKRFIIITSVFGTLIMSYYVGFDIVNTMLLLSFIIVATKLIPHKK